jgi:hypothetical protein
MPAAEWPAGSAEEPDPMNLQTMLALSLNGAGYYIHWGFIQLSLANLVVIILMVVVFVLALLVPFPGRKERS